MTTHKTFITVKNRQMLKCIDLQSLYAITGDGYCATFFIDNQEKFTCWKTLKEIEGILPLSSNYLRINKNAIINIIRVAELLYEKRVIALDNGAKFQVSVRKMKNIKQLIATINGKNWTFTRKKPTLVR